MVRAFDKNSIARYDAYITSGFIPSRKYWNWNIYSNGVALASNLRIRKFAKINAAGDHGITFVKRPDEMERRMPGRHHLTWQEWRLDLDFGEKETSLIKHPWIDFLSRDTRTQKSQRNGTLVFLPHSVPGMAMREFDLYSFVSYVESLPGIEFPISYSLHWHDLGGQINKQLVELGKSTLSAGDSQHPDFAYRFAEMVRPFRFACSPSIGSQLFILHYFGLDYFLIPESDEFMRLPVQDELFLPEKIETSRIFQMGNLDTLREEKDSIVARGLGLSRKSLTYSEILKIIGQER